MKMPARAAAFLLFSLPVPAPAQEMDHSHMDHGAMEAAQQAPSADPHAGHGQPAANRETPPPVPADHAAEAFYSAAEMARSRAALLKESGGMTFSRLMLDRLEYRRGGGADGYHWEGEGWIGGDIDRFAFKSRGEGAIDGPLEHAEVQALYSRAINPWFNLEAGVRHDIRPGPQRTYAVAGLEGLAPYWFEVGAQAFLSDKGDAHLRLEASYDQRITQRLILQPAAEVDIAAQDVPELGIGSGLSGIELGLRLRYEVAREFAPYIGVNWERKLGDSARFARAQGEGASATSFVMGARFWF
ncbi:copper resistance protein B [Sphingobium sp. JS3065]|uniref:copper resistance protein B n=1 Tax=Sphingobium sp. JS3065 TaxID=2970925 RepID=UPI002263BF51|nr:copper resistance protein B [Sphingobium sp. JS3065]UZW55836.1 copper resistance protein B [Sphingobium sp. JS3065]